MLSQLKRLIRRVGIRKKQGYDWTRPVGRSEPIPEQFVSYNMADTTTTLTYVDQMNTAGLAQLAEKKSIEDLRIEKKPVEIVSEIVAPEPIIRLNDIAYQIKAVEARLRVLRKFGGNTRDEEWALRYLRARRNYAKKSSLFTWPLSTDQLIADLVKKYKVQNVGFGGYSRNIPLEATAELEKFGKAWDAVVDDDNHQAELRLITDYQGKEHKKDPILLASSPFGRWWYVLGAWDKEVEIVDEIIYNVK